MQTITTPEDDLAKRGQELVDAAQAYWDEYHRQGLKGAVVWLQDEDGRLVVFTRGEYAEYLKTAVNQLT